MAPQLRTVRRFKRDPVATQEALLRSLLQRAATTEWGHRYGFTDLLHQPRLAEAYRARVPIHPYDAFAADVSRLREGAADVTWPGSFRHFAVSSGTASAGKIIPVSEEMLHLNQRFSVGTGLQYLAQSGNGRFLLGKHLSLPGRIEEDPAYPGTWIGEVSGLVAEQAPAFFKHLHQALPNEVLFRPNWEAKLRAIVEQTHDMDIRLLVMAPTWALVLLRQLLAYHRERTGVRVDTVSEIWPNLQVFISGGVALSSYRELLDALIGQPTLDFVETYGASEGFFSFQDDLADPSMLLHLDNGVYFEFVRQEDLGRDAPPRVGIGEVEVGPRYAPILTTCSGLWAYPVGDVVRFTQTFPHKILVAGRTSEMLDAYGEAVFGEEARAALEVACAETGARVAEYHIAPRPAEGEAVPTHQWIVEFEAAPPPSDAFAMAIDRHLQAVNRHYQIRREAQAFGVPEVTPVPPGTFYRWLQSRGKKISGQTKIPRMSTERTIATGVVALLGNNA
ncbi:MAG: GH3 auxin-responsive promoter family protein [Bacteroidota bacterium]